MHYHAENIICGFARLDGHPVGVVGNQPRVLAGALDIAASNKAGRFVRFCDSFNVPLVTFVDVPGFLRVPTRSTAASSVTAPSCSMRTGEADRPQAHGDHTQSRMAVPTTLMCSKHIRADYNVAWPTAEIAG